MIGQTISHYKILEKLGGGGMGVVYKAEDTKLKRLVALKFLPADLTRDDDAKERFIHEAQAASALDHSNICTIHEIDETEDGQIFICMAHYEGETLKKKIERGLLPIDQALEFAIQIAQGLAKAHAHGIIHRDLKPANVMITKDGVVKIVDFGLAKLVGRTQLTEMGTTLGTVAYMSPEQAQGLEVDYRTDIWSFGVVLYEMLSGQLPFKGEYAQAVVYSILNESPQPMSGLRSGIPSEFERIVNKCLEKKFSGRYQQVNELQADLRGLKTQLESGAAEQPPAKAMRWQQTRTFLYGVGVVLVALFAWYFLFSPKKASMDRKSIAVLPFNNLSESKEDEYFSDGITEDILTQVSKIGELRVISRTSVMQYKSAKKSMREIGNELNVATILEGSVRRAGNQVRIVAQLIDARNDEHLWSETYDKEYAQIFAIQSDVAQKIAAALKARLSPAEKERIEKKPTANLTAYEYYLKGRDYYYRYQKQANENAIDLFKRAIDLDTNYALAWAGLGDAYAQRFGRFGFAFSWMDSAITVSNKAVALDPNSAEVYKALGTAYAYIGQLNKALEGFRKAVECNPNYYPAVGNIGRFYQSKGALDEALRWYKKTVALAPTDASNYRDVGETYRQLDDSVKAEQWFAKAVKLQPDLGDTYYYLALFYLGQGRDEEAKEQLKKLLAPDPNDVRNLNWAGQIAEYTGDFAEAKQYYQRSRVNNASLETDPFDLSGIGLGHILWKEEKQNKARKLLDVARNPRQKQIEQGNGELFAFYEFAAIPAIQNNKAEAYKWLQKAIEEGWRDYCTTLRNPWFENLRNDDQFKQMIAQMKAQVDEMRKRVEEMEKEERL